MNAKCHLTPANAGFVLDGWRFLMKRKGKQLKWEFLSAAQLSPAKPKDVTTEISSSSSKVWGLSPPPQTRGWSLFH